MKILMATSEFAPFTTTGDLGVNVKTLTSEFKKLGHDVRVVVPFYRSIHEGEYAVQPTGIEFQVNLGNKKATVEILQTKSPDEIPIYLIRRDEYFDRSGIYGGGDRAYEDNSERFIFFSKAVVELGMRLSPAVDIIHSHDWPVALIPAFVRDRQLPIRTVLSIHNLEHQGSFWSIDFGLTNLPGHYFSAKGLEFYGRLNFLKGGILYADSVTLPGEPALYESFTPEHGYGLHLVLQENAVRLAGIPFGIDYQETNPPMETLLPKKSKNGGANSGKGTDQSSIRKVATRDALLAELGLDPVEDGFVLNLPTQDDPKALDALLPICDQILGGNHRLILTGHVPKEVTAGIMVAERKYPTKLAVVQSDLKKMPTLALAGSDIALFPSILGFRNQSILTGLRYGTIPIVRFRGGLRQIVIDVDPMQDIGWGFVYYRSGPAALWDSIQRAQWAFAKPDLWKSLVNRAKEVDFSWETSAKAFGRLYAELLRHSQASLG